VTATRARSIPVMGTIVTIQIGARADGTAASRDEAIEDAFDWFRDVEESCNRFDAGSELRRLCAQPGTPVHASDLLFAAVEFALAVAEETDGAFDPTMGRVLEARGFDRDYRDWPDMSARTSGPGAGKSHQPPVQPASYRDVALDSQRKTITLGRPLLLDLGAVAKGLAIDLAARELAPFHDFVIDAGGDVFAAGHNDRGEPWSIGIRHPRRDREVIEIVRVSDQAVCTSGDYERPGDGSGHHILDPRRDGAASALASATVVAPTAMLADALATAAFVLGQVEGIRLLERHDVNGVLLSPSLDRFATRGLHRAILPHA